MGNNYLRNERLIMEEELDMLHRIRNKLRISSITYAN